MEDVTSLATQDLIADRHEYLFPLPACLQSAVLPFLRDARDLPLVTFLFNISTTTLPAAALVFAWKPWSAILGPLYLAATYALYLERFVLALHYSEHSRLFKSGLHLAVPCCCQSVRSTALGRVLSCRTGWAALSPDLPAGRAHDQLDFLLQASAC